MKNVMSKTLKKLGRMYDSLIPDEETARRIGAQYVDRYGLGLDSKRLP